MGNIHSSFFKNCKELSMDEYFIVRKEWDLGDGNHFEIDLSDLNNKNGIDELLTQCFLHCISKNTNLEEVDLYQIVWNNMINKKLSFDIVDSDNAVVDTIVMLSEKGFNKQKKLTS
jgi:hypothetical protein